MSPAVSVLSHFPGILIIIALSFLFYRFSLKRFFWVNYKTDWSVYSWFPFVFIPGFFAYLTPLLGAPIHDYPQIFVVVSMLIYGVVHVGLFYLALNLKNRSFAKKNTDSHSKKDQKVAKIYRLLSLFCHPLADHFDLFRPRFFRRIYHFNAPCFACICRGIIHWHVLEFFHRQNHSSTMIFRVLHMRFVNLFFGVHLPILIVFFLGIGALIITIRHRRSASISAVFFFYLFSLAFISHNAFIAQHNFQKPYVHISQYIEQDMMGVFPFFYGTFKMMNSNEKSLFQIFG